MANCIVVDRSYLYTISNEQDKMDCGFNIQSVNSYSSDAKARWIDITKSFKLKSALGGKSALLDYYEEEDRIAL